MRKATVLALAALGAAAGAFAEQPRPQGKMPEDKFGLMAVKPLPNGKIVKGVPFSGLLVTETTMSLSGGGARRRIEIPVYRDGEGRVRREQSLSQVLGVPAAEGGLPKLVFINDPVSRYGYVLNPTDRTAQRSVLGKAERDRPRELQHDSAVVEKTESLGKQRLEGMETEGTRTTSVIAAGKFGNERPIRIVVEHWASAELDSAILHKIWNSEKGETSTRLTRIVRGEPARSLFAVPADYKVIDVESPIGPGAPPVSKTAPVHSPHSPGSGAHGQP
jgi:hypothetical protein